MTGAEGGKNLGAAGYSYDIVTSLFLPLLQRCGEVIPVEDPRRNLDAAARDARRRGLDPVHFSVLPMQDVCLAQTAPNIVMPAWEFPDIPNDSFGWNPQNNWVAATRLCSAVLVGGPFTADALARTGVETPIRIVQVPTPREYFELPAWQPASRTRMECPCYVFPQALPSSARPHMAAKTDRDATPEKVTIASGKRIVRMLQARFCRGSKRLLRSTLPDRLGRTLAAAWRAGKAAWRNPDGQYGFTKTQGVELSGIVYTSILNPIDGRKNWHDLLTGFLLALGDREDVTLVVKLISNDMSQIRRVLGYYTCRDIPHRCKLVIIPDYLTDEQMLQLANASTYYLQTTKAEGNCLPLMNYLAAGRPGISPCHSAIADYFDDQLGFVVDSHPEPAAWPHDPRLRIRTSWGRIVWPSLVEQIRESYWTVKKDRPAYQAMGDRGRRKLLGWASPESIEPRLRAALELVLSGNSADAPIEQLQAA